MIATGTVPHRECPTYDDNCIPVSACHGIHWIYGHWIVNDVSRSMYQIAHILCLVQSYQMCIMYIDICVSKGVLAWMCPI